MELWQVLVGAAALLYIAKWIGEISYTQLQLHLERQQHELRRKITTIHKQVELSFDLWWQDRGRTIAATYVASRGDDERRNLFGMLVDQAAMVEGIRGAVEHYCVDLRVRDLQAQLHRASLRRATSISERFDAEREYDDWVEHMDRHEKDLVSMGYDLDEVRREFGPTTPRMP